jgi:hypothetical protein
VRRLFEWFSALITCGSCVDKANISTELLERSLLPSLAYIRRPAHLTSYATKFPFMCPVNLMVLDCTSVFAVLEHADMRMRRAASWRVVTAIAVLGIYWD